MIDCGATGVGVSRLDVNDPTTGEVRSSSTDDIACWFIDSDYNEESFFVRHAYFTGADEPYKKLQRALRPRSTRTPGQPSTAPSAGRSRRRRPARSR